MRKIFDRFPKPKKSMITGNKATFGMGYRMYANGVMMASQRRILPLSKPKIAAGNAAETSAQVIRNKEMPKCFGKVPKKIRFNVEKST